MTISGELDTMLGVLGLEQGDGRALDALALVGMPTETSELVEVGTTQLYLAARESGTDRRASPHAAAMGGPTPPDAARERDRMELNGEITTFADALGSGPTDRGSLAALVLVDLPTARSDHDFGEGHRTSLRADQHGVELLYRDGTLSTVFITTGPSGVASYPRPDALIDGLSANASRAEVLELFGTPDWSSEEADRFQVGERCFLRFEYADDAVAEVSVMREVPR